MAETAFYGWYADPNQAPDQPSYNPPFDAPCLYCGLPLTDDDVRTHSMMYAESSYAQRSYFYRTHRSCHEADPTKIKTDSVMLDMIAKNGD